MKRLIIAVLILLSAAPCLAFKLSNEIADITYLLRCWPSIITVADQSYTNGQTLGAAQGCLDGSLTLTIGDGGLSSASSKLTLAAQTTPAWTDLGGYGPAITKAIGTALFSTINLSTWEEVGIGFSASTTINQPTNWLYGFQANATDGRVDNVAGTSILTGLSTSTSYPFVTVMGGYDSNGVPYKTGDTKANYAYGATTFYKTGSTWTLSWKNSASNSTPVYPIFASLDAVGTVSGLLIPTRDFSSVLQPTFLDTFTDTNGTALSAHTPDVGGAWALSGDGNLVIGTNRAVPSSISNGHEYAVTDLGINNVYASMISIKQYKDDNNRALPGLVVRYVDTSNMFFVYSECEAAGCSSENVHIIERSSGVTTTRATTSNSVPLNTEHTIIAITSGNTINGYIGSSVATYTSSLFNTSNKYGIYYRYVGTPPNSVYIDNFAVWPLTSATQYDAEFAKVGY